MITGIAHNAVTVRDMQESLRFYTKALDFTKAFELDRPENGEPWIVYLASRRASFWSCSTAAPRTIPGATA